MLKKHLLEGVKKGAFDEAEATKRFEEWVTQNEAKIEAKKSGLEKSKDDELGSRLAEEKRINEARTARLAKRKAELDAKLVREVVAAAAGDEAEVPEADVPETEVTEAGENASEVVAEDKPQE
jgi:small subunit ribosomal protein S16